MNITAGGTEPDAVRSQRALSPDNRSTMVFKRDKAAPLSVERIVIHHFEPRQVRVTLRINL
nr:hypothetical protein [Luminiphilus sp.]